MNPEKMIKGLYKMEQDESVVECQEVKITLRLPAKDAALFNAIANRFNSSRFDIVQPILHGAAETMFQSLTPEDRRSVAVFADSEINDFMKKQGATISRVGCSDAPENEWADWRDLDWLISNHEKEDGEKS